MRAVIQRVSRAEVRVNGAVVGRIGVGFLILVGFTHRDGEEDIIWCVRKIAGLRVFEDEDGKMNLDLAAIGGAVLAVSQFTLYADVLKGRRPAFIDAAEPKQAERLYDRFCERLSAEGITVARGVFGARMEVDLTNNGPVTILLDSPSKK